MFCRNISELTLTNENWDRITQENYHFNFLNDRNAIRAVLNELLKLDKEIKNSNTEIQNLKTYFDLQLNDLEVDIKNLQDNKNLIQDEKNKLIAEKVKNIEKANLEFSNSIEKYQLMKEKNCESLNENIDKLFKIKSRFKNTHEQQVENLKRFCMVCDRSIRSSVDIRLKSIDRKFCDELFYINSCEDELKHIFSLLDDKSSYNEIHTSPSSSTIHSDEYAEFVRDFAWMRNEQAKNRCEVFEYFKKHMAKDIISALAAMHIHQPNDPIKFMASYLKHLKKNESLAKKQEMIFAAAKNGESLFDNNHKNDFK